MIRIRLSLAALSAPALFAPWPLLASTLPEGVHADLATVGLRNAPPAALDPFWVTSIALLLPLLCWLGFAWWQAIKADPDRPRRRGLRSLRRLLQQMRQAPQGPQPQHLLAWQRAVAQAWGVPASAPTVDDLQQTVHAHTADSELSAQWRKLWLQAEQGAFAAQSQLPIGWLTQMSAMAEDICLPRRSTPLPARRTHWFPVLALLLLGGLFDTGAFAAEGTDGLADASAVSLWQQRIDSEWNDAGAHHNLALSAMLQEEWSLAAAHAATAFLLQPSAARRDHLRIALGQANAVESALHDAVHGPWYRTFPFHLSAASWQRTGVLLSVLLALTLSALVLGRYLGAAPHWRWTAIGLSGFWSLMLLLSLSAWQGYGELRDLRSALLVRSVNLAPEPTDLVPEDETSPLPAGAIVQTQASFLGWLYVTSSRGPSGWVRTSAVMPLYAPLP
jgi:hypothetical protein